VSGERRRAEQDAQDSREQLTDDQQALAAVEDDLTLLRADPAMHRRPFDEAMATALDGAASIEREICTANDRIRQLALLNEEKPPDTSKIRLRPSK
jgi:hypothetical protein